MCHYSRLCPNCHLQNTIIVWIPQRWPPAGNRSAPGWRGCRGIRRNHRCLAGVRPISGASRFSTASYSNARAGDTTGRQTLPSRVCSRAKDAPKLERKAATSTLVSSTTSIMLAPLKLNPLPPPAASCSAARPNPRSTPCSGSPPPRGPETGAPASPAPRGRSGR